MSFARSADGLLWG